MNISPISNIYVNGAYLQSAAGASAIKSAAEISSLINSASSEKTATENQKSTIVTDSADIKGNTVVYDYRFLPGVPLSKSQDSEKTSQEPQKTTKKENHKKSFSNYAEEQETEEETVPKETTGKGFYIVLSDTSAPPEKKTVFTPLELWQERINSAYHLKRMKQNGTLVNLTF